MENFKGFFSNFSNFKGNKMLTNIISFQEKLVFKIISIILTSTKLVGKSTNKASILVPPVCLSVCRGLDSGFKGIFRELKTF